MMGMSDVARLGLLGPAVTGPIHLGFVQKCKYTFFVMSKLTMTKLKTM